MPDQVIAPVIKIQGARRMEQSDIASLEDCPEGRAGAGAKFVGTKDRQPSEANRSAAETAGVERRQTACLKRQPAGHLAAKQEIYVFSVPRGGARVINNSMESSESSVKVLILALASLAVWPPCDSRSSDTTERLETKNLLEATEETGVDSVWSVAQGAWESGERVLRGIPDESCAAAVAMRSPLECNDFECEIRFRLLEEAKVFQVSFKPRSVQADKEGVLFSVLVARNATKILRHRDRSLPGDRNRAVAEAFRSVQAGAWQSLAIRCVGEEVSVEIEGAETIRASHPEFALRKGTVVLRVAGGGVEIDQLLVRIPKEE